MHAAHRFDYSTARHPFVRWVLDVAGVEDLEALLKLSTGTELHTDLCNKTKSGRFRALVHTFVREVIQPQLDYVPNVQDGAYVRLHRPGSDGTKFHSDFHLGHGDSEENIWIALSPATLWVLPTDFAAPRPVPTTSSIWSKRWSTRPPMALVH